MYNIELLVIIDNEKLDCTSIDSFKNLLQSNKNIRIGKKELSFNKYIINFSIQNGAIESDQNAYFHVKCNCKAEKDIEKFNKLIREIKKTISILTKDIYILWDDISLYYSQKAYPILHNIENLMRKLISKFMLTNVGLGWMKKRIPSDVEKSINLRNKDLNFLQNVDFIQLNNILFSENYPSQKEGINESPRGKPRGIADPLIHIKNV